MKLIIIAGLPGAGKSTYITKLKGDTDEIAVYDDYYATQFKEQTAEGGTIDTDKNPLRNSRYTQLIRNLISGKTVIASDIIFLIPRHMNTFIAAIVAAVPDVELEIVYFEPALSTSVKNIETRGRDGRVEREKMLASELERRARFVKVTMKETYDA